MKHLFKVTAAILFLTGNYIVQGQFLAPGGLPAGFHHALYDVLVWGASFYGRATIQLTNGPDAAPTSISFDVAVLGGAMRIEADSFVVGTNVPAAEAANLKRMHSISILRPDRNRMYLVYPTFRSYVELAYSKSTGTEPMTAPKISKTFLTNEMVGIQPCVKSQWSVVEENGEQYGMTVWTATNLGNFPLQIKLGAPPVLVDFEDVHFDAPDSSLFEPPAGYSKYEGIQEIIERNAAKPQNTTSQ